jgi:hypothetical protein
MQLFFFDQDQDSHWYMIPVIKRNRWNQVKDMDPDNETTWKAFEEFEEYRTGGGISHIEFMSDLKYLEE